MIATALAFLNGEEGFRSKPYLDTSNVATIGYGSTFYKDGTRVKMSDPAITKLQALDLKKFVVNKFWDEMKEVITVPLNDNQKVALISLVYNIGVPRFKTSTVLRLVNAGSDNPEIAEAFKMWRYSNGQPILLSRRIREVELYFKKKSPELTSCCCPCHC